MITQEQIQELENTLEGIWVFDSEGIPRGLIEIFMECDVENIAEQLYEAGYRKQSEVAKEIFEEIEQLFTDVKDGYEVYHTMEPEHYCELKKKYTEEQK